MGGGLSRSAGGQTRSGDRRLTLVTGWNFASNGWMTRGTAAGRARQVVAALEIERQRVCPIYRQLALLMKRPARFSPESSSALSYALS
jgi:hypothetical protein